jgi:hypothetical protein
MPDLSGMQSLSVEESRIILNGGIAMRTIQGTLILALLVLTTQAGCLGRGCLGLGSRCCTPCGVAQGCEVCGPERVVTPCAPAPPCGPAVHVCRPAVQPCVPVPPCAPTVHVCRPAIQPCAPMPQPCANGTVLNAPYGNTADEAIRLPSPPESAKPSPELPRKPVPIEQ